MSTNRRGELGALGEQLATEHMVRLGLRVLDRNFRTRWGELDIVACDPRVIVFCEVKTRIASHTDRSPLESVHTRKRAQLRRMAAQWLAQRQDHPRVESLRFDAIGVTLDRDGRLLRLEHLEAAF
jgi:putative endonuclease